MITSFVLCIMYVFFYYFMQIVDHLRWDLQTSDYIYNVAIFYYNLKTITIEIMNSVHIQIIEVTN